MPKKSGLRIPLSILCPALALLLLLASTPLVRGEQGNAEVSRIRNLQIFDMTPQAHPPGDANVSRTKNLQIFDMTGQVHPPGNASVSRLKNIQIFEMTPQIHPTGDANVSRTRNLQIFDMTPQAHPPGDANVSRTKNLQIFDMTPPDVAVTGIEPMKTVVGQGFGVNVSVAIATQDNRTEGFNLKIYVETILVGSQDVVVTKSSIETVVFTWNTSGFARGNYTIRAEAAAISGEIDLADNTLTSGAILVTIPGDINGDQYVNAKDAVILGGAFGSTRGDPTYSSNADINGDDWCNAKDAVILGTNFGQSW